MVAVSSPISLYRTQANQPVYTAVFTTTWPRPEPARPAESVKPAELVQQAPARSEAPSKALLATLSSIVLLDSTPLHERVSKSQILAAYQRQDLTVAMSDRASGESVDRRTRYGGRDPESESPLPTWDVTMVPEGTGTMVDTYA